MTGVSIALEMAHINKDPWIQVLSPRRREECHTSLSIEIILGCIITEWTSQPSHPQLQDDFFSTSSNTDEFLKPQERCVFMFIKDHVDMVCT